VHCTCPLSGVKRSDSDTPPVIRNGPFSLAHPIPSCPPGLLGFIQDSASSWSARGRDMTRRNASGSPTTVRRGGPRARKAQGRPLPKFVRLCLAVTVLAFGGDPAGVVQQAHGRWKPEYADAPYREWYQQQHDKIGWTCCELSDAHPVYDAYIKHGNWHVPIRGRTAKSGRINFSKALIRPGMPSFGTTVSTITSSYTASPRDQWTEDCMLVVRRAALLPVAIGPKLTWVCASQMSAFGGKAEINAKGFHFYF
jgi:hypothetical protein